MLPAGHKVAVFPHGASALKCSSALSMQSQGLQLGEQSSGVTQQAEWP